MRIVQFANTLAESDGGPARNSFELNVTFNLLESASADLFWFAGELGNSVVCSYSGLAGPMPYPGPRKISLRSDAERRRASFPTVAKSVMRADAVVIHGYYLLWLPPVVLLLKVLGKNFLIAPHGSLTRHQQKAAPLKKAIFELTVGWWIRRCSAGFVTGSQVEANDLRSKFPLVQVSVGGVGTALPTRFREDGEWGKPLRLVSLSRIAAKKRIDLTIGAVESLRRKGVNVDLDIIGSGDASLLEQLRQQAARQDTGEAVSFLGHLVGEAKTNALLSADLFILPSEDENFGIGVAEALAHGVPVIASSQVASAHLMSPEAGMVLNESDAENIADAVLAFTQRSEASVARAAARKSAVDSYGWEAAARRWLVAIKELTGG